MLRMILDKLKISLEKHKEQEKLKNQIKLSKELANELRKTQPNLDKIFSLIQQVKHPDPCGNGIRKICYYQTSGFTIEQVSQVLHAILQKSTSAITSTLSSTNYSTLHDLICDYPENRPESDFIDYFRIFLQYHNNVNQWVVTYPEDRPGKYEERALHMCARKNFLRSMKLFIDYGADVGARDSFGKTPIDLIADKDAREDMRKYTPWEYHRAAIEEELGARLTVDKRVIPIVFFYAGYATARQTMYVQRLIADPKSSPGCGFD